MKRHIILLVFCFSSVFLSAQVVDSVKSSAKYPVAEYFKGKDFFPNNSTYTSLDTLLDGVQKYLPAGPKDSSRSRQVFPNNFPYSLGLVNRKSIFEPNGEIGFRDGFDNLDLFGYNKDDIKYYRTRTPHTEIFVLFGMKKEQFSKLLHTQNITQQWNVAVTMLRIRSEGFYQRQNCTDNNMSLSSNYISKNNRYSFLASSMVSSIKTDENGGIAVDSLFEDRLLENKKLIPVNLMDARTKRRYREIYIKQSLYFGKSHQGRDPSFGGKEKQMKGDSVISSKIFPKHSLSYSFNASDNLFVYAENKLDSSYYENTFFDPLQTFDSTRISTFQHTIYWKSIFLKKVTAEISFNYKASHLVQYKADSMLATDTLISDNILHLEIGKKIMQEYINGFYWNMDGNYITDGNNEGDYSIACTLSSVFKKNKKILFTLTNNLRSAPFIYYLYTSNHFWWRNSFDKTSETRARLNYTDSKNKFSIGAEINQIAGYVYFDTTFSPKQFDTALNIYSAFIQKNIHLKHFHFDNKIIWQESSHDVIHIPQFISRHSIYYEGKWFKKAVEVQLGFDVAFFTSYYGDAYMPALGQYYLQNERMLGNYPFVDFFFNMKVRRARIFFKTEHVNSGLMGPYYLAPHVPAPDRSIKVGINWMFYD